MKPFNLEEYLANPSMKVVTRMGRDVRIICTDRKGDCPIVALVKMYEGDSEDVATYSKDGATNDYVSYRYDLFFAPKKKEGWINIYVNNWLDGKIYPSKKEALSMRNGDMKYITTTKIEWEEY